MNPTEVAARAANRWRLLLAAYAIALTTGTHWPHLELQIDDVPAPDKVLHMLGFGGLTFLLWQSRWFGRAHHRDWLLVVVAAMWTLADELTQAIPVLGRTFSWLDVVGGWLGVFVVMCWCRAVKPLGGPRNAARRASNEYVLDRLTVVSMNWLLVIGAAMIAAAALGIPLAMHVYRIDPNESLAGFAAGAAVGGTAGAMAALAGIWHRAREIRQVPPLPRDVCRRAMINGALALLGALSLTGALVLLMIHLEMHIPWAMVLIDAERAAASAFVPANLRLALDLAMLAIVLAAAVRIYRETIARAVDTLCSDG